MTTNTPSALLNMLSVLRARVDTAEEQVEKARGDLEAVERTVELMRQEEQREQRQEAWHSPLHRVESIVEVTPSAVLAPPRYDRNDFAGMSQREAILALARQQDGVVRVPAAGRMLVETKLTASKRNASQIVLSVIQRTNQFDWIAPGTYRLKEYAAHNGHDREQAALISEN